MIGLRLALSVPCAVKSVYLRRILLVQSTSKGTFSTSSSSACYSIRLACVQVDHILLSRRTTTQHNNHKERNKHHEESSGEEMKGEQQPPQPPPSRLRIYVIATVISFAVTSLLFSTIINADKMAEGAIPQSAPTVSFEEFVKRFLPTGEVKNIAFIAGKNKALVNLHNGAVIDGKPAVSSIIVIDYNNNAQQFWADVRKNEAELGIGLSEGVPINMVNPISSWKVLEFMLGVMIIMWLAAMYGRVARKNMMMGRAKTEKK